MVELLSPAGNLSKLKFAILYGANAVYLAMNKFGMRAAADNFTFDELREAVDYAHKRNVKVYVTVNVLPHEYECLELENYLNELKTINIDAVIVADLGVISLCKKIMPNVEIHVSTQAGIVNSATAEEYLKLGCKRVVLARELTLNEIKEIRRKTSKELSLEAFIHGSMCVSFSGRCLLSNYLTGRDANCGKCAQPCRWDYNIYEIEEVKRPGMRFPVQQDPNGTFIMSSKDMCTIEHIPELIESGIDSFKIEGRMKSEYYTAVTANAYRMSIDKYYENPDRYEYDSKWMDELNSVSHREYCTGYYFDNVTEQAMTVTIPGYIREKAYLAYAKEYDSQTQLATFVQRNKLSIGEEIQLVTPGKSGITIKVEEMWDENDNHIESAPHPFMEFKIKIPFEVKPGDIIRAN